MVLTLRLIGHAPIPEDDHDGVRIRTAVPDTALAAIRRYCNNRVPPQHPEEIRVEYDVRGKNVTIYECRPPWHPDLGPTWSRQPIAQLRYDPDDHHWRLYWADRNGRWHPYGMREPTTQVTELLGEIDADPTGIFRGSDGESLSHSRPSTRIGMDERTRASLKHAAREEVEILDQRIS